MNFRRTQFVTSAIAPLIDRPQVILIGRSNVGKSSFLNALCDQGLAYVSKTPGRTQLLNYFLVDESFYLVDAPGYGYRKLSKNSDAFDQMMQTYFSECSSLKLIVWLLDPRRELSEEDQVFIDFLKTLALPMVVVFTKADKLNQSEKVRAQRRKMQCLPMEEAYFVSSLKKTGFDAIRKRILQEIS